MNRADRAAAGPRRAACHFADRRHAVARGGIAVDFGAIPMLGIARDLTLVWPAEADRPVLLAHAETSDKATLERFADGQVTDGLAGAAPPGTAAKSRRSRNNQSQADKLAAPGEGNRWPWSSARMASSFEPGANLAIKLALISVGATLVIGVLWWWLWPRTEYARFVGFPVSQPVPFSHEHHVGGLGIDCRFCHTSVEVSATAGMPPTYVCMTCHSQIWTNAEILAPVRQSLAQSKPIIWNRVTNLPDYVFFNHSIHIAKGVGCSSCHGEVVRMQLTMKAKSLTMQFCLNCHRDPGPNLRPKDKIFNTEWRRTAATPPASSLLAQYHMGARTLTDCSICHR